MQAALTWTSNLNSFVVNISEFTQRKVCREVEFLGVFKKFWGFFFHERSRLPKFGTLPRATALARRKALDFITNGLGHMRCSRKRAINLSRVVMMKKIILLAAVFVLGWLGVAQAQVWVDPYTRRDGTYVGGHYRSNPDGNPYNNWSYPGNVNPYTGKQATGDPNRYLEQQYQNRNQRQNQYQLNPYQFRW
jgi:hypothetical protein